VTTNEQDVLSECERLRRKGLYWDAVLLLSEGISSSSPPSAEFYFERGECYVDLGEFLWALDDFTAATALAPDTARYWTGRGHLLYTRLGRSAEAIDDLQRAISADPASPIPQQQLSLCYLELGNTDIAAEHASRALELDTANANSHFCLGLCHRAAKRLASALDEFFITATVAPENPHNWSALGGAYEKNGDAATALECYKKATELRPSASDYISMAAINLDAGNRTEAMACLNSASKLEMNDVQRLLFDCHLARAEGNQREKKAEIRDTIYKVLARWEETRDFGR